MMKMPTCLLFALLAIPYAQGDIINWKTGETIPGTENVTPAPGTDLSYWNSNGHNLNVADFKGFTLNNSTFESSWLRNARFFGADLTNVNFKYADLSNARIGDATLVNADLTDAIIEGASFYGSTWIIQDGFTEQQFYSTKSYKDKNTRGIDFSMNNLRNWDFQNLDLTSSRFYLSDLNGADFTNAIIRGVYFTDLTRNSMTKDLIYSTRSYQERDLRDIDFSRNSFYQWDFTNQNLANTSFYMGWTIESNFSNANLTSVNMTKCFVTDAIFDNAIITGASFLTNFDFSKEQLYSTRSYQIGNLQGVAIGIDLRNWDFTSQDLTDAALGGWFQGANFSNAIIKGARFHGSLDMGFTKEMIYSTKSYAENDLEAIKIIYNNVNRLDLRGVNLSNQNLKSSRFEYCDFRGASFRNTDLSFATFENADLDGADFTGSNLTYSQFDTGSSYLENANFSLSDLRLSQNFIPHGTTIISNSINVSGRVFNLNLKSGDKLTVRTILDSDGYRITPITFEDSMVMEEGSTINLLLRDYRERHAPSYLMRISDGIIPQLNGILELSLEEGEDTNDLIGRTFYVMEWGDVPLDLRYFGDLTFTPNLYCDFTDFYTQGTLTIIPEPTSFSILAIGSLLLLRRKRKPQLSSRL